MLAFPRGPNLVVAGHEADALDMPIALAARILSMGRAVLRPRITVAPGTDEGKVHRLVEKAHAGCIVANSIRFPVDVEAEVLVAEGAAA